MRWTEHEDEDDRGGTDVATVLHQIDRRLSRIERLIMTVNDNQAHLDQDITDLGTAITTAVTELKAAIAAGTPAQSLDFTALDALVASTQAEATADAPPQPPVA